MMKIFISFTIFFLLLLLSSSVFFLILAACWLAEEEDLVDYEKPLGVKKHENGMNEIMLLEKKYDKTFPSLSLLSCVLDEISLLLWWCDRQRQRWEWRVWFGDVQLEGVGEWIERECFLRNCFGFAAASLVMCDVIPSHFQFFISACFCLSLSTPTTSRKKWEGLFCARSKLLFTLIPFPPLCCFFSRECT